MAINVAATGSVENEDLQQIQITRQADGSLIGSVVHKVTVLGLPESRTASWTLSAAEKTAAQSLLPGAKQAIADDVGL